jgi:hypothetical protein
MTFRCPRCNHPLDQHSRDPRNLNCPQDRFRFTFKVGEEQIHEMVGSVALAQATARVMATSRHETVRTFKHGARIPYSWEG